MNGFRKSARTIAAQNEFVNRHFSEARRKGSHVVTLKPDGKLGPDEFVRLANNANLFAKANGQTVIIGKAKAA